MSDSVATLEVPLGERGYEILIGADLLDRAGELLAPVLALPEVVVVTDANLERTRHPARLERALDGADIRHRRITVPAGEASKSMGQLEKLVEAVLERGAERKITVVALGGGVVGDLAGFAAAVLLRGVGFVQIPTTLLSQVDSSVGGKTGVNSRHGKNLIGAFHQPARVLVDTSVLDDLPVRELKAGYAELVKHAFIKDRALFAWLETHAARLFEGDPDVRRDAIHRSLAIKAAVVAADERETRGERALLNFGHTFGHAYEAIAGYGTQLLHGEAVSIGMASAFALSQRLGLCPAEDAARALEHLRRAGLPVEAEPELAAAFTPDAVIAAMRRDKKVEASRLAFVLSRGIGEAFLTRDVPEDALRRVLDRHA
ncbi:3-dehydroquinate synthase [Geminicoccaceae bacterium 1502E]|nr:3-dehydroquinate synthase [Geminicoccaceae bacterium 1502E]